MVNQVKALEPKLNVRFLLIIIILIISTIKEEEGFTHSDSIKSLFFVSPSNNAYTIHDPINIISNQNFTDYSFPGSGTAGDPYRIENYYINTTEEKAININNVDKSFVVQRCFVSAEKYGIYVENAVGNSIIIRDNECTNNRDGIYITLGGSVSIINNTCYQNENYGIKAYDIYDYVIIASNNCSYNEKGLLAHKVRDVEIYENICSFNTLRGLTIWETDAIVYQNICDFNSNGIATMITFPADIYNNTCRNNIENGIRLSGASDSIVTNNTCTNNGNGIYNINSFHTTIVNNTCINNENGLFFDIGSWYCKVSQNSCLNNSKSGIALTPSRFSSITNNTIQNNKDFGIYSERSIECSLTYNLIQNNANYGVYLNTTTNSTLVAYNYFINNNPSGSSQGYDAGKNNEWFDKENKEGNYWSDWKGRGKYSIDGSSETSDKYPLNEQLDRATFSPFLLISLSLVLISIPLRRRKCKKKNKNTIYITTFLN